MSERTSSIESETTEMSERSNDGLSNIDTSIYNEKTIAKWDPLCIRKKSNWSSLNKKYKMDDPSFHPEIFLKDMPHFSPKLVALLDKIKECDAKDEKKYGTTFKHFIFSDIKSGDQGAKMLASALISTGWTLGYKSELKNREKFNKEESLEELEGGKGDKESTPRWGPLELLSSNEYKGKDCFYLLSSVPVYDKPISVRMKKEILANFNSRPQNIYGDIARIIVMDSGFKEGIDLFDIKYIHIFEPSMNIADQKQVIGRGTRTCGQKGLEFHPTRGWPLNVFVYDMEIPDPLRLSLLGADSTYDLLMRAMNADIRIANFSYDVERLAVLGSVDYDLNKNVHQFEIDLSDENEDEEIVFGGEEHSSASTERQSVEIKSDIEMDEFLENIGSMGHKEMKKYIEDRFGQYKWGKVKMENLCGKMPDEWRRDYKEPSPKMSEMSVSSRRSSPKISELSVSSRRSSPESSLEALDEQVDEKELVPVSYMRQRPISEISTISEKPLSSSVIKENMSQAETESLAPSEAETISEVVKKSPRKRSQKSRVSMKKSSTRKLTPLLESEAVSVASSQKGGASAVLEFTPTQAFVQHYFTPVCPVKGMLLYHSVGTGKCHAKDTPILMYDGSIKMVQDIQIGELLMGDDSTPRKVLSLASGEDEMYDIIPKKGEKYTVNSEHILCLQATKLGITYIKSQSQSPYVVRFINIKTKSITTKSFSTREEAEEFQEYVSQDNIMEIEVKDYLNLSKNLQRQLKGYRTAVNFKSTDVSLDPYLLGYWLGDGSQRGPVISSQDATVLKYMRDYAIENDLTFNYQSKYDYRFSGSREKGNKVLQDLQYYKLINNKHIPLEYKANDKEIRLQLLAGLIDSDGYCDTKGKCYEITQKNKVLAEDIVYLCRSLGFAAYMKECQKSCIYKGEKRIGTYWRMSISGANLEDIPVKINRKKQHKRTINKNALVTGITVESIGRGEYYGFTLDGNNRYVLGDFTVTHNTCSAIAAATTNFEPMGYTILWVTRTTLKNDIWKNMFDQVCHKAIQERIMNGEKIPDTQKERMRLLSKEWRIRPMSYKQFSNLVSKKNALYGRLVKENGEADPLRKTLLIIDEAHKLYGGGDLSSLERPDMDALHSALMNSYIVSGMDSVRVLLMTATPVTENPMELIKLMNLCRPVDRQLPNTFETFAENYLNKEGGFTSRGQLKFLDDIAGYISYLNREKDARQFSQPRIKKVMVPMVADIQTVQDFDKYVSRTETENNILVLQKELDDIVGRLESELSGLSKKSFQTDFFQLCDKYPDLPKKKCETIVNRNLTDLMRDVNQRIKTIREQIKALKTEIASLKKGKKMKLTTIHQKILASPLLFEKYKLSTYYAIRNKCSSKTLEGTEFMKSVQELPEVIEIDQQIQVTTDTIATLEKQIKIETIGLKGVIKGMKAQLKDKSIAPVQKMQIEHEIRDKQIEFRKTQKEMTKNIQEEITNKKEEIKELQKDKKDIFKTVRKTLKNRAIQKKKEEKSALKTERKLKKTRSLFEYKGELITLTQQRKELVERDIKDEFEHEQEKIQEKMKKQSEKEHQKTLKKRDAEEEKERKKLAKIKEKEHQKTVKQRDAEEEKERKNLAKIREKEQKQAEKERQKTLKKRDAEEEKERKKLAKIREKEAQSTRKKQGK